MSNYYLYNSYGSETHETSNSTSGNTNYYYLYNSDGSCEIRGPATGGTMISPTKYANAIGDEYSDFLYKRYLQSLETISEKYESHEKDKKEENIDEEIFTI